MAGKKILLVHLSGGIGDLLLSTALLKQLKAHYENSHVAMLIREEYRGIVDGHPCLDEIISVQAGSVGKYRTFVLLLRELRSRKFDIGIVLWSTAPVAWLLFLSGIPLRVGQDSRLLYSFLYTHRVSVRSERGDVSSHWVECLLDYIRALNCTIRDPEVVMEVGDESYRKVDTLLDSAKAPLIGLHVGKGIPLDENRWPVQFFARLADAVAGHFGGTLILTGDSREKRLVDQVESLMERRALNMAGKTSLKELAALVSRCRAFICPDSAPGHIAAAMKVPTVALFALKSDFPERWKPYGTSCAVVRPESIECSRKCIKEYCPQFRCYEQISTDQVLSALEGLLNESAQEREKLQE